MDRRSYIVLSEPPGPYSQFVEAECDGRGIKCGDWEKQENGFWRLYLNLLPEIINLEDERDEYKAIVAKLPQLADGSYWIPRRDTADLYHPACPGRSHYDVLWDDDQWLVTFYASFGPIEYPANECYRIEAAARAAAEAARKERETNG